MMPKLIAYLAVNCQGNVHEIGTFKAKLGLWQAEHHVINFMLISREFMALGDMFLHSLGSYLMNSNPKQEFPMLFSDFAIYKMQN